MPINPSNGNPIRNKDPSPPRVHLKRAESKQVEAEFEEAPANNSSSKTQSECQWETACKVATKLQ